MIDALLNFQYLQKALMAGLLASVVCGIIGVIIIEKKLIMMSSGIAHTAFGGVGLGYLLNFEPIYGAFLFAVLSALGIGTVKRKTGTSSDVTIGLLWSLGMALGVLFIGMTKGYAPDISSYLFGSILSVTKSDLYLMLGITLFILIVFVVFYTHWKTFLFDPEYAGALGINIVFIEYALLILIALAVIILIRAAGIILMLSLLVAPAATVSFFTAKFKNRIIASIIMGAVYFVAGLWLSYYLDIQTGATIVFVSVIGYFLSFTLSKIKAAKRDLVA